MRSTGRCTSVTLLLFFAALLAPSPAASIEAKCSACAAVAFELKTVLDQEKPRDPLDFRGRLDGKGERFGKVVNYRVSELRIIELLGDLCGRLANYAMWSPSVEWAEKHPGDEVGKQWVKIAGDGAHAGASEDASLKGAKGKVHHREIQAYCSSLVETLEDQLTDTLRADGFQSNTTEQVLCRRLTSVCRGIRRKPKAAAAEATGETQAAGTEQPASNAEL